MSDPRPLPLAAEEIAEGRRLLQEAAHKGVTWGSLWHSDEAPVLTFLIDRADRLLASAERFAEVERQLAEAETRAARDEQTKCSKEERAVLDALVWATQAVHIVGGNTIISVRFSRKSDANRFFLAVKRWRRVRRKNALDTAIDLNTSLSREPKHD